MTKETQHVEYKSSFNEDVIETLVAFANTRGGKVYVGVDDKGKPVKNFTIGKESLQNWANEVKNKTQSQIIPDVYTEIIDNQEIAVFEIQEYPIKPVSTRGRYYRRIANSNHLLSLDEIANEHLKTKNTSWDYYPRPDKSLQDISIDKVEKIIALIEQRNPNLHFDSPMEFLLKNELLLEDNKITNGCYLLFSYETICIQPFKWGISKTKLR
ncbi:MAG: putative DNA binding domain-containing protein [Dysgonamonadaceae bacterium]|jgi:ATP-dependent DNA helicase RecG|nr:putative DNA binding domain-containing protein [Dysgonamonadaceae bacterium]